MSTTDSVPKQHSPSSRAERLASPSSVATVSHVGILQEDAVQGVYILCVCGSSCEQLRLYVSYVIQCSLKTTVNSVLFLHQEERRKEKEEDLQRRCVPHHSYSHLTLLPL